MLQGESDALNWLAAEFARSLAEAFSGMGCEDATAEPVTAGEPSGDEESLWLEQPFNLAGGNVWVGSGNSAWRVLGAAAMQAIGLDSTQDTEIRDTYREIITQSLSGLASSLTKYLGEEITCGAGSIGDAPPNECPACCITVSAGTARSCAVFFATNSVVLQRVAQKADAHETQNKQTPTPPSDDASSAGARFGLLLDVEMPVNVSLGLGRISLQETLTLTPGSNVSLGRTTEDLMELTVNGRLVARGEIVVARGQYAFRIHELSSLRERLNHLGVARLAA